MGSKPANKRLHFIVRHDEYDQIIGYGYFLDYVFNNLNKSQPKTAKELLEKTAMLMLNPHRGRVSLHPDEQMKDANVFFNVLPVELKKRLGIESAAFFDPKTDQGRENAREYFKHITMPFFGELYPQRAAFEEKRCRGGIVHPERGVIRSPIHGPANVTLLLINKLGGYRSYFDTLTLIFLHPHCDQNYFNKLIKCIEPLLAVLDRKPLERVTTGTPPPQEKMGAMITIYWLLAQSTPVFRGGSAYANVILEHMAERLRVQGYDYEVPYTREGIDLWAQAVTLPLEDNEKVQGFKSRFKAGLFFDTQVRDEDIENYMLTKLQPTKIGCGFANFVRDTAQKRSQMTPPDAVPPDYRWFGG